MANDWTGLYGLSRGIESALPFVQEAFMAKQRAKERKQGFVSDYYLDLLKRGEIEREEPVPIGPMAGPVPSEGPLAGYLRPPPAAPRPPTAPETFDIMEALAEGRGLPPGFQTTPTKIPKGLEPYQFTAPSGITYRTPSADVKSKTDPRFSELMSLASKHWGAYKEAIDNDDELGIELYSKRFDATVGQAESIWRTSNPEVPLPRFDIEELAKDPNAWQKFWKVTPEPERRVIKRGGVPALPGGPVKKIRVRVKATGQTGTINENEFDSVIYERL